MIFIVINCEGKITNKDIAITIVGGIRSLPSIIINGRGPVISVVCSVAKISVLVLSLLLLLG